MKTQMLYCQHNEFVLFFFSILTFLQAQVKKEMLQLHNTPFMKD